MHEAVSRTNRGTDPLAGGLDRSRWTDRRSVCCQGEGRVRTPSPVPSCPFRGGVGPINNRHCRCQVGLACPPTGQPAANSDGVQAAARSWSNLRRLHLAVRLARVDGAWRVDDERNVPIARIVAPMFSDLRAGRVNRADLRYPEYIWVVRVGARDSKELAACWPAIISWRPECWTVIVCPV